MIPTRAISFFVCQRVTADGHRGVTAHGIVQGFSGLSFPLTIDTLCVVVEVAIRQPAELAIRLINAKNRNLILAQPLHVSPHEGVAMAVAEIGPLRVEAPFECLLELWQSGKMVASRPLSFTGTLVSVQEGRR